MLVNEDGNSTARELAKETGRKKARYGGIAKHEQGASMATRESLLSSEKNRASVATTTRFSRMVSR